MTIQEIFERYEILDDVQHDIFFQAAYIKALHRNWVGPDIDWRALTRGALFYDIGNEKITTLVRKKVGVDKFIVNVISRSVEKRLQEIVDEFNFYHKILMYSALLRYSPTKQITTPLGIELKNQIEEYSLHAIDSLAVAPIDATVQELLAIDIKHYKNPSV